MFDNQPTIISSAPAGSNRAYSAEPKQRGPKLAVIIAVAVIVIAALVGAYLWFKYKNPPAAPVNQAPAATTTVAATNTPATLPGIGLGGAASSTTATTSFSDLAIEYMSFADFYKAPDSTLNVKLNDYQLPLNVKVDVMNYYDISRKLNLDPALSNLNKDGFATIDNPWAQTAPDFYSLSSQLDAKQIPLLISSDFVLYYYQNILKKSFKDIEADVFYDNLWSITKDMYQTAKTRYETRLGKIGQVNDPILEGERLEAAFLATALELLKPTTDQLSAQGAGGSQTKFSVAEGEQFYFTVPPYLRDDVLSEEKLIRAANTKVKSPELLYQRDYNEFKVPPDYRLDAKLNNFYLTVKWLNSVWPLNYRDKNCPACLLDYADWRINLTAASFLSQDFSASPDLKNKWARIYKVMYFFKGLREELSYVQYRDALSALFGADYNLETLLAADNQDAILNLNKLKAKLLTYDFPAVAGARDPADKTQAPFIGFRLLAENYFPNAYIFSRLSYPNVTVYQGKATLDNNVTACSLKSKTQRCGVLALDPINLVSPVVSNPYFTENTNYLSYSAQADALRSEMDQANVWHLTDYWLSLDWAKSLLEMPKTNLPIFARGDDWRSQSLKTAVGSWVNLQLPLEKFTVNQLYSGQGLASTGRYNENSYVEPAVDLYDELLADNAMLIKMFLALQLDKEVAPAINGLEAAGRNLTTLKNIAIKELTSVALTADDNLAIADFAKQLTVVPADPKDKQLTLSAPQKNGPREDLSRLKLMILIHREGDSNVFAVGPVWDYKEIP